jgi:hypothetical protein
MMGRYDRLWVGHQLHKSKQPIIVNVIRCTDSDPVRHGKVVYDTIRTNIPTGTIFMGGESIPFSR